MECHQSDCFHKLPLTLYDDHIQYYYRTAFDSIYTMITFNIITELLRRLKCPIFVESYPLYEWLPTTSYILLAVSTFS